MSRCWPWWTWGTWCRTASPVRWTMRPSSYLAGAKLSNVVKDDWLNFSHFSLLSFYIPMVIMVTTYALTIHHLRFIFISFQTAQPLVLSRTRLYLDKACVHLFINCSSWSLLQNCTTTFNPQECQLIYKNTSFLRIVLKSQS